MGQGRLARSSRTDDQDPLHTCSLEHRAVTECGHDRPFDLPWTGLSRRSRLQKVRLRAQLDIPEYKASNRKAQCLKTLPMDHNNSNIGK